MSRYMVDIMTFMRSVGGKSVYAFVVDGSKGSGGCPLVALEPTHSKYVAACEELLGYMKRSVALFEQDIAKMKPQVEPRSIVFEGIANDEAGRAMRVRRYSDGTSDTAPLGPPLFGCFHCGGVYGDVGGARAAHAEQCQGRSPGMTLENAIRAIVERVGENHLTGFVGVDGAVGIAAQASPWMGTEDGVARVTGSLSHPTEGMVCTGAGASWCPIHGDSSCPRDESGGS